MYFNFFVQNMRAINTFLYLIFWELEPFSMKTEQKSSRNQFGPVDSPAPYVALSLNSSLTSQQKTIVIERYNLIKETCSFPPVLLALSQFSHSKVNREKLMSHQSHSHHPSRFLKFL